MSTTVLPHPAAGERRASTPAAPVAAPAAEAPVLGTRIRGIEELLPPGERVLWVGAPHRRSVARDVLHVRALAIYFGLLLLVPLVGASGDAAGALVRGAGVVLPVAVAVVLFASVLAQLVARTTVYAITDRRVAMRIGIALPMTINLPLDTIVSADLRPRRDGLGDIVLTIDPTYRLAYLLLWPHARPWRYKNPQPTLVGVESATTVGQMLGEALEATRAAAPTTAAAA